MENKILGEILDKIKNIVLNNKKDIIALFILVLGFVFSFAFIGRVYGDLFMDCGREAYLPQLILQGKVLFKDIFGMYNPLAYQINAVLYLMFGSSINTLYLASCFNALLFIFGMFFISRMFLNEYYSCVINLLIMSFYVFGSTTLISYLMPYAFAFPYAATFFTFSTLAFLLYMKSDNKKFIYCSMLLMGLSFACKAEFILCILPMFAVMFYKKEKFKTFVGSIITLTLPVVLSYGILFLQGFSWADFKEYMSFLGKFFRTDEQLFYTFTNIALAWKRPVIEYSAVVFSYFILYCALGSCIFSLFHTKKIYKYLGIILIPAFAIYTNDYLNSSANIHIFCWVVFALIPVLYFVIKNISEDKNKMLLFLIITGILSMARVNFLPIMKGGYSIFFLLPLLSIWILFINTNLKFLEKYNYKKYVSLTLLLLALVNIYNIKSNLYGYVEVNTSKGKLISQGYLASMFNNLVDWVEKNTKPNDTVLLLPEGIMVNYVTGRPTLNKLYHLIPNHISALGENNILNELSETPPKYIVINYLYYGMYNESFVCNDFGKSICKFVHQNYSLEKQFKTHDKVNNKFESEVYKLKGISK